MVMPTPTTSPARSRTRPVTGGPQTMRVIARRTSAPLLPVRGRRGRNWCPPPTPRLACFRCTRRPRPTEDALLHRAFLNCSLAGRSTRSTPIVAVDHIDQAVELDATSTSVSTRGPDTEMFGVGRSVGGSKPERPEERGPPGLSSSVRQSTLAEDARCRAKRSTIVHVLRWDLVVPSSTALRPERAWSRWRGRSRPDYARSAHPAKSVQEADLTVGGCHVWSRIGCLAQYLRVNSEKGPSGAGSQFASRSVPGDPAPAYNVSEPRSPR